MLPTVSALDLTSPNYKHPFFNVAGNNILSAPAKTLFKTYVADNNSSGTVNEGHTDFTDTNLPLFENELGIADNTLDSVCYSAILYNGYNYGYNATFNEQTPDHMGNVEVDACNLSINKNTNIGIYGSGLHNPTTAANFDVYTAGANCNCGAVTVKIDATGSLEVGDSAANNTGTFWVGGSSTLSVYGTAKINRNCRIIVQNGAIFNLYGRLDIAQNARIVVQKGGIFYYRTGGVVRLYDTGSVVDIQGELHIPSGANFVASQRIYRF